MRHFCDRSNWASEATASCRWLARPRGARGLSDTCHTSNPGRRGDANGACRDASRESVIFERNCSEERILVLFALHSLRRAIFFQNPIFLGFSMETRIAAGRPKMMKRGSISGASATPSASVDRCWSCVLRRAVSHTSQGTQKLLRWRRREAEAVGRAR